MLARTRRPGRGRGARCRWPRPRPGRRLLELLAIAAGEGRRRRSARLPARPRRAPAPESVDWFERDARRAAGSTDVEAALAVWAERERARRSGALERARASRAASRRELAELVAELAVRHRRVPAPAQRPDARRRRGGRAARRRRGPAGARPRRPRSAPTRPPTPAELAELLGHVRVPLWRGLDRGPGPDPQPVPAARDARLRPVRRRAHRRRLPGPRRRRPAALRRAPARARASRPAREPAAEERYLFYSCVSRPERSLCAELAGQRRGGRRRSRASPSSTRSASCSTRRRPRTRPRIRSRPSSPMRAALGDVVAARRSRRARRATCAGRWRCCPRAGGRSPRRRRSSCPTGSAAAALAERRRRRASAPRRAAEPGTAARTRRCCELLGARDLFGASTLEAVRRLLLPLVRQHTSCARQPIEPDPEPLETGGIVHAALERLYREPPGGRAADAEPTLERWIAAGREPAAGGRRASVELGPRARRRADHARPPRRRARPLPAPRRRDRRPDARPARSCSRSASGDGARRRASQPAELGSFRLHGRIDRIDVSADGKALIRDYKLSSQGDRRRRSCSRRASCSCRSTCAAVARHGPGADRRPLPPARRDQGATTARAGCSTRSTGTR